MKTAALLILSGIVMDLGASNPITVTLDQPPDGSVISNTVTLSATPFSSAAPIVRVEYYLDGTNLIATATNPIPPPQSLNLTVISQ